MSANSQIPRAIEYTVAWISAIVKEYTISCALLDEEYDRPPDIRGDYSAYTFGRIGQHFVVMACLPLATYGTSQASRTMTEIQRTFPSLKIGLMVGIAGGAPLPGRDIRLGDVVVSEPDPRRRCGGVIHYTSGRNVQDIDFEPTSTLNTPDSILLSAAAKLKSYHERRGHRFARAIDQVIEKHNPKLNTYKRPDPAIDVLYKPNFTHSDEASHCLTSCLPNKEHIVTRVERDAGESQSVVHYGLIGSADVLMRDAILRDKIAQRDGVLCFEMESAGLMSSELRCLAIRGICDYSDTHKNDDWQKYAAAMAAAYAKELLEVVPKHRLRLEDQQLQSWRALIPNNRPGVLKVLRYDNMNDKHQYSTPGLSYDHQWIWSTSFDYWLSSSDEPYWICGKPGSGKSTLIAYLVHNHKTLMKLNQNGAKFKILHFFYDCKAGSALANNIHGMLRMFLYQLADQFPQIKKRLQTLLDDDRLKLNTPDELLELVCDALKMSDARFCVFIDGLDEYEGDLVDLMHTCKLLKDLVGIKLCFGSRPEARISEVFDLYAKIMMQDYNIASMYGYASKQLLRESSTKPEIISVFPLSLQNELIQRAEGILLWFKLAFDDAVKHFHVKITLEEMRSFIKSIPRGLDAIYESILDKIPQQYTHEAALLLFLVQQLRDLNQAVHDLSSNEQLSTIVFSATDIDHVWGAYDFMFELIGDQTGVQRVNDQNSLQGRIKFLLSGLVEVYEVKPEEAITSNTSNLDVRYVHKTLYSFIKTTNWMSENLHPCIKQKLPEPFWLCFLTEMIVQATKDQLLTLENIEDAKKDTIALKDVINIFVGQPTVSRSTTAARLIKVFSQRHSTLIAIYKAFGLYGSPGEPGLLEGLFLSMFDNFSSNFAFSSKWASRHVILRTAFLNLPDLARQYEAADKSSFTSIQRAMQSYLNVIMAFHTLMPPSMLMQDLLISMINQPNLNGIWDLVIAIAQNLHGYFEDRMFQELPATVQERDFLVHTVVATSIELSTLHNIDRFAGTLAANKCYLTVPSVCYFFTNVQCLFVAAYHVTSLSAMIPPNTDFLRGEHCNCKHQHKNVGLLFHWARFACINDSGISESGLDDLEKSSELHLTLLDFLLKLGIDINMECYCNGNVLHAILDESVRPLSGRQRLQLRAKFLALTKRGINPRLVGKHGLNALESAKALRTKQSRWSFVPYFAPDLAELNFVIKELEFYGSHGKWPSEFLSDNESENGSMPSPRSDYDVLALLDPEPELEFDRLSLADTQMSTTEVYWPEVVTRTSNEADERYGHQDDNNEQHDQDGDDADNQSSDDEFFNAEDRPTSGSSIQEQLLSDHQDQEVTKYPSSCYSTSPAASDCIVSNMSVPDVDSTLVTAHEDEIETPLVPLDVSQIEQIWNNQALHFSADTRLIPVSIRRNLLHHEADTWMFVFQTLQNLGLRMSPDVDNYITCALEASEFRNVRLALINVLELHNRTDLLADLYELEIAQFSPLLVSDVADVTRNEQNDSYKPRQVPSDEIELNTSSSLHGESKNSFLNIVQPVEGLGIYAPKLDHVVEAETMPEVISPPLSGYTSGSSNVPSWGSQSLPSLGGGDQTTIRSPSSTSTFQSPRSTSTVEFSSVDLGIESGMLAHRKLIDPCRRENLKVDPGISTNNISNVTATGKAIATVNSRARQKAKSNAERARYDYVLLEDFRWTIIEHLGYGHNNAPSRKIAEQFLAEADWDFDRAITRYIDSIESIDR